jgi:hypothetical protein
MTNGRCGLVREPKETLQAEASVGPTQRAESEPLIWNPPALTTWKIEEETLEPISGPKVAADFGG